MFIILCLLCFLLFYAYSCHTTSVLLYFFSFASSHCILLSRLDVSVAYIFKYASSSIELLEPSYKSGSHKPFAHRTSSPPKEFIDSFGLGMSSCHHWNKDCLGRKDFRTRPSEQARYPTRQSSAFSCTNT